MAVSIAARERLQYRRCHLEYQRDDSDLGKRETELVFYYRINRRYHGLNHVVEQMGDADNDENGICRSLRDARIPFYFRAECPEIHIVMMSLVDLVVSIKNDRSKVLKFYEKKAVQKCFYRVDELDKTIKGEAVLHVASPLFLMGNLYWTTT